jgi:predicted dehydrogenase
MSKIHIGFIGAGGIARAHAYSLNSLKYFYNDAPEIVFYSVTSASEESRTKFSAKYGFQNAESEERFFSNDQLDAVFILGPNKVHYPHLKRALEMPAVKYVYLEKPVCSSEQEEKLMKSMISSMKKRVIIQVGFQFLLQPSVREALAFWQTGILGRPIHFDIKYFHGDYLKKSYRDKRQTRLTPAPDGGAMADLGSHAISLIMAFLGEDLSILSGLQAGNFPDVPAGSDLFSSISLVDNKTKAVGSIAASRISSGTGDLVSLELYGEKGALRFNSQDAESFEYYLEDTEMWTRQPVGSNYTPVTSFPSGHVSPGWLRSMMHAHYVFFGGSDDKAFIPDLKHGLAVQRIVRETATHLDTFRRTVV